jgi:hypothetical protein
LDTETRKNFQTDIELEHKFSQRIKTVLGNQFITQDRTEDLKKGTDFLLPTHRGKKDGDFLILEMRPFRVGCRLRRSINPKTKFRYYPTYKNEFTIRWKRPSGVKTEIHKINEGLVDYILYGFVDEKEEKLVQYFIGDLEVFRNTQATPIIKPNRPLDSWLAAYRLNQFPERFILKWYERKNQQKPQT